MKEGNLDDWRPKVLAKQVIENSENIVEIYITGRKFKTNDRK